MAEGKYTHICLGDTATENYACNPLSDEDKASLLYMTPEEQNAGDKEARHKSLGYYCSGKDKLPANAEDIENGKTYSAINLQCHGESFPVPDMHKILQVCFNSSEARLGSPMPSIETCQDPSSNLKTSADLSNVYDGDRSSPTPRRHKDQNWPQTYVHTDV